ncbi:MAG: YdeI/OmpD-associated family protein [Clostridiaceae bacterium]
MTDDKKPREYLILKNVQEWRKWLEENYEKESEVWLKIRKKSSEDDGIFLDESVSEAICFGWIDGKMRSLDEKSYILRFTPRKQGSLWSRINQQRAETLIKNGRMTEVGMKTIYEAKISGRWQSAYTARVKPDIPEDLNESLEKDIVARDNFCRWPNSSKLQAIVWIQEAKRSQTRQKRISEIVSLARRGEKL